MTYREQCHKIFAIIQNHVVFIRIFKCALKYLCENDVSFCPLGYLNASITFGLSLGYLPLPLPAVFSDGLIKFACKVFLLRCVCLLSVSSEISTCSCSVCSEYTPEPRLHKHQSFSCYMQVMLVFAYIQRWCSKALLLLSVKHKRKQALHTTSAKRKILH